MRVVKEELPPNLSLSLSLVTYVKQEDALEALEAVCWFVELFYGTVLHLEKRWSRHFFIWRMIKRRSFDLIGLYASIYRKSFVQECIKKSLFKSRSEREQGDKFLIWFFPFCLSKWRNREGGPYLKRRYFDGMLNNNIIIKKYGSSTELITGQNIVNLATRIKKIKTVAQLKIALNTVERYAPLNYQEKTVKRIYLFILEMHLDRPWLFKKQNVGLYSEMTIGTSSGVASSKHSLEEEVTWFQDGIHDERQLQKSRLSI